MRLPDLAKEFPRDAIHWRAQTLTRDGDKALALAYLDARDVMDRLDEVCGPENWQTKYLETPTGRVLCNIGIKIGDEWVWKSDGAGATDIEGEKGGISDSLKRAAVLWGIGRYLYRLDAVWAPCETYQKGDRKYFSKWRGSPWDHVRNAPPKAREPEKEQPRNPKDIADSLIAVIGKPENRDELNLAVTGEKFATASAWLKETNTAESERVTTALDARRKELDQPTPEELMRA